MSGTYSLRPLQILSLIAIILVIGACSSGGDGDSPANDNNNNSPTLLKGVLLDVEGVEYSSASETGVTDADGSFNYIAGDTVKFFMGDILIGEIPARAVVTSVDLAPGAPDETNIIAVNIYRYLLSLDSDDDLTNGIQISQSIRSRAVGQTLNFNQNETNFENSAKVVVADLVNSANPDTVLVPSQLARDELRNSLLGIYLGYYEGTFNGDDSGTWKLTVDANGNISGEGFSNNDSATFTLSGTANSDGNSNVSMGGTSTGAAFSGVFNRDGKFSGTWENTQFGETGTFSGNKTTPPDDGGGNNSGGTVTTDPNLNAGVAIYNTVIADFPAYNSASMSIKAPDIAENGAVVPVTVTFPSNTGSLWVFVDSNDEKIAAKADYLVSNDNGYLSIRLKMKNTGNVIAVFDDGNGNLIAAQKQVKITIGGMPQACTVANCTPLFENNQIRVRDSGGTFKMLITSAMNVEDYIVSNTITLGGIPNTVVYFTPFVSQNPYLSIKHATGVGVEVVVEVQATNNRSASVTLTTK